jgi:hypothetical protein
MSKRPKVVVLGMMSKMPVAGVVWQTIHYLVGLERLGYESWYVEAHCRTPSNFVSPQDEDGSRGASQLLASILGRFGLSRQWAFHALHSDGRCYGISDSELRQLYKDAALIINLHGGTVPLPEHSATGRLVYLETDPVQLQIELNDGCGEAIQFLRAHHAFFTFGENYGRPDCRVPVSEEFAFLPTRQPVVLDFWDGDGGHPLAPFTTVGNWKQGWRTVRLEGKAYSWSKHQEFHKFLDVPARTASPFELALANCGEDDARLLTEHGWALRDGLALSADIDEYRSYIRASRAEFTVAKEQNIRLRSGWFSDRSATYLAAGRPVITQDTAYGNVLPTGEGLFPFSTLDDVVDAVERINGDYDRHCRAAKAIAREFFDSDAVLKPLLAEVGA